MSIIMKFYEIGEVWNNGPCIECQCNIASYQILNCSLVSENGLPGPAKVETVIEDTDRFHFPSSCPPNFTEMKESNKHLPSIMFVVYRTIKNVATSCCDKQTAILPDECEAIPDETDPCKQKYVLRFDNTIECPVDIAISE
ncbi:uncharacterized protein LOC144425605 isoform X2 [Styela clava]